MSVSRETDSGGETHRRGRNDGRDSSTVADEPARGPTTAGRDSGRGFPLQESLLTRSLTADGTIGNYLRSKYPGGPRRAAGAPGTGCRAQISRPATTETPARFLAAVAAGVGYRSRWRFFDNREISSVRRAERFRQKRWRCVGTIVGI